VGEKIKVFRVLDKEITIHEYRIEPSTKIVGDLCLWMQITFNDEKRVIFTSSKGLRNMISQTEKADFPMEATIIEVNKEYQFLTE
jgi:hypothetical protein